MQMQPTTRAAKCAKSCPTSTTVPAGAGRADHHSSQREDLTVPALGLTPAVFFPFFPTAAASLA